MHTVKTTGCLIHLQSIDGNTAKEQLWIRICTADDLVCEFEYPKAHDTPPADLWPLIERDVTGLPSQMLFAYSYSGNSGVCLKTQRLFYNDEKSPNLTLKDTFDRYVHVDEFFDQALAAYFNMHESRETATFRLIQRMDALDDLSGNTYYQEWIDEGQHRYLVKVPDGQPSKIERSIGRITTDFLTFNDFKATILRIVASRQFDFTVVELATTQDNEGAFDQEAKDLKTALGILHGDNVNVRVHIYANYDPPEDEFQDLNGYLHRCFQLRLLSHATKSREEAPPDQISVDDLIPPA